MLNTVILKSQKLINQDRNLYLLISVIRTYLKFWWRLGESNSWPPACKAGALPTKLSPQLIISINVSVFCTNCLVNQIWWVWQDLNLWPHAYQACALTNWATDPQIHLRRTTCCGFLPIVNLSLRRWSSRRFPYGYLVTTSPQSSATPW